MKLTKDQKTALAMIADAGAAGIQGAAGWTAAQSLVRKGLVKVEIVAENVPATKFYPEGTSRFDTHTIRGRIRILTIVRWTVAA